MIDTTYEQFSSQLLDKINEKLGEADSGIKEVSLTNANKNNDNNAFSLTARFREGDEIAPSLYTRPMYDAYNAGASIDELADRAIRTFEARHGEGAKMGFDVSSINPESAQDHLFFKLVNGEMNPEMKANCAHVEVQDLIAVPRWSVFKDGDGIGSILVDRNFQTNLLHMTDEEVLKICRDNLREQEFKVQGLSEVLREMMPGMPEEVAAEMLPPMEEPEKMYVLTNEEKVDGAIALMSKDALEQVHEKIGEDFYVIPSSIHEVLCVPESAVEDPHDLKIMCEDVNATQVALQDRLGDNIYHCDGHNLNICNTREQLADIREAKAETIGADVTEGMAEAVGHSAGRGM
ncbi:MAG: DUF5688 family protein [Lachnospiraceae bacterium]|nr:DUF5688 family protein [Lachnospiraceae bacterium]